MESILDHVEIDFSSRTVELFGEDGEYQKITCEFNKTGYEQFMRVVKECQDQLPEQMQIYKV